MNLHFHSKTHTTPKNMRIHSLLAGRISNAVWKRASKGGVGYHSVVGVRHMLAPRVDFQWEWVSLSGSKSHPNQHRTQENFSQLYARRSCFITFFEAGCGVNHYILHKRWISSEGTKGKCSYHPDPREWKCVIGVGSLCWGLFRWKI